MASKNLAIPFLNHLTAERFLREYWQKKPLLIRGAFPDFDAPLAPQEVLALAARDDVESRLITHRGREWQLQHGPLSGRDLKAARGSAWTVLLQDTQHFSAAAHDLLSQFDFIPRARIDDLMVSYAVKGGGVGPHFDSYDVFLLQGEGKRRWQIAERCDLTLKPDMPLKILSRFKAEQEWVLEKGDMLYLPPSVAHNGIAVTDLCLTWSIGFRAPSAQELSTAFLDFLRDELSLPGLYADPDLQATRHPAQIDPAMMTRMARMLKDVASAAAQPAHRQTFIGRYLTEPKSHVFFDSPEEPLSTAAFRRVARRSGLRLDLKTRMLYVGPQFFMNGEQLAALRNEATLLKRLADRRLLAASALQAATDGLVDALHPAYCDGWLHLA
jgi:50S ribosomal protein L16 3-hydroxylase